jgi:hypothetical protein
MVSRIPQSHYMRTTRAWSRVLYDEHTARRGASSSWARPSARGRVRFPRHLDGDESSGPRELDI